MFSTLLIVTAMVFAVYAVETAAYLAMWPSYYHFGPAFHREMWQASASVEDTMTAIETARPSLRLSTRRSGNAILMRFGWQAPSTWPRIVLRIVPSNMGAVLVYEVRPFISMALLILVLLIGMAATPAWAVWLFALTMTTIILCAYAIGWHFEMRRLNKPYALMSQLSCIGVQSCASCGYDRHRLPIDARCPECGCAAENQKDLATHE